jgi:hypothetical protein
MTNETRDQKDKTMSYHDEDLDLEIARTVGFAVLKVMLGFFVFFAVAGSLLSMLMH